MAQTSTLTLLAGQGLAREALLAALQPLAPPVATGQESVREVYLDTLRRSLARAGLAARWRRADARSAVEIAPELLIPELLPEVPVLRAAVMRGQDPALLIKQTVEEQLPLRLYGVPRPELELRRQRRSYRLERADGLQASLRIDEVTALVPGRRRGSSLVEVALQLLQGPPAALAELGAALANVDGLGPAKGSALALARQLLGLPPTWSTPPSPDIAPLLPVDQVARSICLAQWQQVRAHEPGTRAALDPEQLHKMRVSTRRLRAALRTFGCCFPKRTLEPLVRDIRWLATVLGEVRDMDVQLMQLPERQQQLGPEPQAGWASHGEVLAARRTEALARLRLALDSVRYQRLCQRAQAAFASAAPRRPRLHPGTATAVVFAGEQVQRRVAAFQRAAKKCKRDPRPARLHALRIRGKRLRYTCEFFAPLYGASFAKVVARLRRFQDVLGLFNDSMVAGELARAMRSAVDPATPAAGHHLYVLGLLDGACRAGAELARVEAAHALKDLGGGAALDALTREAVRAARRQQKLERAHETLLAQTRYRRGARAGARSPRARPGQARPAAEPAGGPAPGPDGGGP